MPTLLRAHPADLCAMGIGENGHIAFNDPPFAEFEDPVLVKVVRLDQVSRQAASGRRPFQEHRRGADPCRHVDHPGSAGRRKHPLYRARSRKADAVLTAR